MKRGISDSAAASHKDWLRQFLCISEDVLLGKNVRLSKFINLYGCTIGDNTKIGAFVEIQKNAMVGKNCKISSHSFVCEGVVIEDDVFIGHGVAFTNDVYPRATADGRLQSEADWVVEPTLVKKGASIGTGATILPRITIGDHAIVGAGSVVVADVPPRAIVAGNPARLLRYVNGDGSIPAKLRGEHGRLSMSTLRRALIEEMPANLKIWTLPAVRTGAKNKRKDGLP